MFTLYSRTGWDFLLLQGSVVIDPAKQGHSFLDCWFAKKMDPMHNSGQEVKSGTSGKVFFSLKKMKISKIPIFLSLNVTQMWYWVQSLCDLEEEKDKTVAGQLTSFIYWINFPGISQYPDILWNKIIHIFKSLSVPSFVICSWMCPKWHKNHSQRHRILISFVWVGERVTQTLREDVTCCCCSVAKLCLTLCNPMDWSTSGFPVLHYLPEFSQTHGHRVVMPSNHLILFRPLLLLPSILPSITVFFQWVSSSQQVGKVLELQLQYQSFQWVFRVDLL